MFGAHDSMLAALLPEARRLYILVLRNMLFEQYFSVEAMGKRCKTVADPPL